MWERKDHRHGRFRSRDQGAAGTESVPGAGDGNDRSSRLVPHIAKQGASSSQTMTSLPDPPTLGAAGSAKQCTPAFIDNPVWSPTQPVLADKLGLPAGSTDTNVNQSGTKTFNVTIPANATCTEAAPCTLQVLMFMTDHPSGSCNYHHCADISIAASTDDAGVSDASTDARGGGGQGGSGMMTTGSAGTSGTGTAGRARGPAVQR